MLYVVADSVTECVEKYLANNEDQNAEADVAKRPAVIQGIRNQQ